MDFSKSIILSTVLYLVSCGESSNPPNTEQIEAMFKKKFESFESIRRFLNEDHEIGYEYVVRTKRKREDISKERYDEYLNSLNSIPAEKASFYEHATYIPIFAAGLVTGGCLTQIIHNPVQEPSRPSWADPYNLVVLGNDWYGETRCN